MSLITTQYYTVDSPKYAIGTRTGIRNASNFSIKLGFKPKFIRLLNLTTGIEILHYVNTDLNSGLNDKSLYRFRVPGQSYVVSGINVIDDTFTIQNDVFNLDAADGDTVWEAFG